MTETIIQHITRIMLYYDNNNAIGPPLSLLLRIKPMKLSVNLSCSEHPAAQGLWSDTNSSTLIAKLLIYAAAIKKKKNLVSIYTLIDRSTLMVSSLGGWLMFLADFYRCWNSPRGVSVKPSSLLSGAETTARIWVQGFVFDGRDEREWLSWLKVFVFFLFSRFAALTWRDVVPVWCKPL